MGACGRRLGREQRPSLVLGLGPHWTDQAAAAAAFPSHLPEAMPSTQVTLHCPLSTCSGAGPVETPGHRHGTTQPPAQAV